MSSSITNVDQECSIYLPRIDQRSLPLGAYHGPMTCSSFEEYLDNAKDFIALAFTKNGIGAVKKVDLVEKQDARTGYNYLIGFVHFEKWEENEGALSLQRDMADDKITAKLHVGDRYWICAKNKKKSVSSTPQQPRMSYAEMTALIQAQNDTIARLEKQVEELSNPNQSAAEIPDTPELKRSTATAGEPQPNSTWSGEKEEPNKGSWAEMAAAETKE